MIDGMIWENNLNHRHLIRRAAGVIRQGGLVTFPTETVKFPIKGWDKQLTTGSIVPLRSRPQTERPRQRKVSAHLRSR